MAILFLSLLAVLLLLASFAFFLGFRLGGDHWQSELQQVRIEAIQAERQIHDLTRHAFIAMAEQVELHKNQDTEIFGQDQGDDYGHTS
jgi:hypothetical protein